MFESRLYRDAFGSDFISDSTGHKYIEFKNLSDERLGILKNSNNDDTSYTSFYLAGKIRFSSEEICLTDYDMNNLKNEHFSITMIVVPYIDAFKYMKIKNPTYQDWKKHIIPLKKYTITKEKLESSNWTLTYP